MKKAKWRIIDHALPLAAGLWLLALAGCATPIGVNRLQPQAANRALTANVLTTGRPSAYAREFLYRWNLSQRYRDDPTGTIALLHSGLGRADQQERLFALAELSFDHAERSDDSAYHLATAVYAWAYLFPDDPAQCPGSYDPRLRIAMDLYNRSLASGLATGRGKEVDLSARTLQLPFGALEMDVDRAGFSYGGYGLEHFFSLADYEIRGLRNRYRRRGIGAPLVASAIRLGDGPVDRWLAPRSRVPLTALLHVEDPRRGMSQGALRGTLRLYDSAEVGTVQTGGQTVPLEAERTAALAYQLEGAPVWDFEIAGFRRGDFLSAQDHNLVTLHPHHPGRMPVVFVHGTASSPARWAEMTNELMNDRGLSDHYEFWYFLYNTGNPVIYSSMALREALQAAVRDLDPDGKDPALRRMVVIGHSQGGLLTKMTSVDSGTRFWDNVGKVPFEEAKLDPETHDLLQRTLFVKPLPFIGTLIFIATPHRGSFLADNILGTIARKLISLPGNLTKVGTQLMTLQASGALKTAVRMPTSIDNMKGSDPFLKTLITLPIAPGVHAHSIIPVEGDGPPEQGDDGVVKYSSAHIDGVESELVVRSGHSTQSMPETIEEVRRILYEHLPPR